MYKKKKNSPTFNTSSFLLELSLFKHLFKQITCSCMFFFQLCKALWQAAMSMLFSFFLNFQSIGQYGSLILINYTTVLQEKKFQLPIYVDVPKTIKNVQTDLVICNSFLFPIKYIQ